MTHSQRLHVEQSEKREKINALLGKDELTDEERGELDSLTKRAQQIEVELRAALVAEDQGTTSPAEPDAEQRERIELRGRARLTNYLLAAAQGLMVDGAERELQQAAGVSQVPLELFDVPAERSSGRTRRRPPRRPRRSTSIRSGQ